MMRKLIFPNSSFVFSKYCLKIKLFSVLWIIAAVNLTACGGGSSGDPDTVAPEIKAQLAVNETITDVTAPLTFTFSDNQSGVDPNSIKLIINGVDLTSLVSVEDDKIIIAPGIANYWKAGDLVVKLEAKDRGGNVTSVEFTYSVQPATASLPIVNPSRGDAPLRVQFFPFNTTNTAIETYEWDFDGDGEYDVSETVGRNQAYTYSQPGTYTATLRLTDSEGEKVEGQVVVEVINAPPVVKAEAIPSNGAVPLNVFFQGSATDNEGVAKYEWDFEGDGTFDTSSENSASENFTYTNQGVFHPVLKVTDTLGVSIDYSVPNIEVRAAPPGSPTVTASASREEGDVPLDVRFSATATDPDGNGFTKWEWDFDGDGTYDQETDTRTSINYQYETPGTYYARVRVTASDNGSAIDVIKVKVKPKVSLVVSKDTFEPGVDENVVVKSTLGGNTEVSVIIEDRYSNLVRTLVPMQVRAAGDYEDTWDGTSESGVSLLEGEYRAILLYKFDGQELRYDLGLTSGGQTSNPPRSKIPSTFAPLAGDPLKIDFTLDKASEITAFIGRYNVDTRLVTFMQRRPLGAGSHSIIWNGEDSTGQLIHPPENDSFLFGIFAYTLPDNAIYLRTGAHINDTTVTPAILVPTSVGDTAGKQVTKVKFDLSGDADVRLLVYNADTGTIVFRSNFTGLTAGENEIIWDGKDNDKTYVNPGKYRLGVTAIDKNGFQSITRYVVQQVYY